MRVPSIVHLLGFPASGKLTIARTLADHAAGDGDRFVVLDNHHSSNVILAALDLDGVRPIPAEVWDRVGEVRAALLRAIEDHSPPDWSFVFTNVVTDDKPRKRSPVDELMGLASRTGRVYLPVVVRCEHDSLLARVANADRRVRSKWTDHRSVGEFVRTHELVDVSDLEPLTIDSGVLSPDQAATLILARLHSDV